MHVGISSTLMVHLDAHVCLPVAAAELEPARPLPALWQHHGSSSILERDLGPGGLLPVSDMTLPELSSAWCRGWLSNLDYLLALNAAAGRRSGDPNNHPIVPWVIDFQAARPNQGWRDLTYTKYRLTKGDQQLDIAWESIVPHHVSDTLSELTFFVYMARRTPVSLLCRFVRSQWVPNEYPSSMARMYSFSPDECIPEFYTDATIFKSMHADLPDLEVPAWAQSPEEFIRIHRLLLESDEVSAALHHWIDLTFGYKLSGEAAKTAKNVVFAFADGRRKLTNHGVVRLFSRPHPQRTTRNLASDDWQALVKPPAGVRDSAPSGGASAEVRAATADTGAPPANAADVAAKVAQTPVSMQIPRSTVPASPGPAPTAAIPPGSPAADGAAGTHRRLRSTTSVDDNFVSIDLASLHVEDGARASSPPTLTHAQVGGSANGNTAASSNTTGNAPAASSLTTNSTNLPLIMGTPAATVTGPIDLPEEFSPVCMCAEIQRSRCVLISPKGGKGCDERMEGWRASFSVDVCP